MMVFSATAAPQEDIAVRFFCQQNFKCRKVRPDGTFLFRREDAKRALEEAELDRTIADQFAVDFNRD